MRAMSERHSAFVAAQTARDLRLQLQHNPTDAELLAHFLDRHNYVMAFFRWAHRKGKAIDSQELKLERHYHGYMEWLDFRHFGFRHSHDGKPYHPHLVFDVIRPTWKDRGVDIDLLIPLPLSRIPSRMRPLIDSFKKAYQLHDNNGGAEAKIERYHVARFGETRAARRTRILGQQDHDKDRRVAEVFARGDALRDEQHEHTASDFFVMTAEQIIAEREAVEECLGLPQLCEQE